MRSPAEFVIALFDLIEVEALGLRRGVARTALAVAVMFAAALIGLGGLTVGLWGIYLALGAALSPAAAALVTGAISLLVAGALVGLGTRVAK